jgi:hypothetical protein
MFATALPFVWFAVTQSMPAMTPDHVPLPEQLRTRTATMFTLFATPYVEPPMLPATCVPWPLQSFPFRPSPTVSVPTEARPPNSPWLARIPVSITYAVTPTPESVYVYVPLRGKLT